MPDYPYAVPPGYTEGTSGGSYNPETGERTSFALPPAPIRVPEDTSGMVGIDWNAVQQNIQNHGVEQALKATAAAIQFQGQRGYQQALKNGEPAEKAMAKFGPMMFYRVPAAFGPSVKALTPPPVAVWTPGTNGAPSAFTMPGKMPLIPKPTGPRPADVLAREKFDWMKAHPKANPEDYETVRYPGTKPIEGLPAVPGEVKTFLGIDALAKDKPAQPAIPGVPGTPGRTRKVLIAKTSGETAPAVVTEESAPKVNEVIKIAPNGKRAVFDADTKKFLRYAD